MQAEMSSTPAQCIHHWVIEIPNGPTSHGYCKACGKERDFYNNPEDARIGQPEMTAPLELPVAS